MIDIHRQNQIKKYFDGLFREHITPWKNHRSEPLLEEFLQLVKQSYKNSRLLDLGCGDGWIAIRAAKKSFKVWGIDSSETAIKRAKEASRQEGISGRTTFQTGDALKLPYDNHFFEAMIDRGLLHHILPKNRPLYFKNITRVLKPGALVYLAVFSQKNPFGIGQLFSKKLVEELFGPYFRLFRYKEDPYPTSAPAHLLHFIFQKKDKRNTRVIRPFRV